jgi:hypothetical protein
MAAAEVVTVVVAVILELTLLRYEILKEFALVGKN